MFTITERLRTQLETARRQHQTALSQARQPGLVTEEYVRRGKIAEYQRGRSDGLRLAIETIVRTRRQEAENRYQVEEV